MGPAPTRSRLIEYRQLVGASVRAAAPAMGGEVSERESVRARDLARRRRLNGVGAVSTPGNRQPDNALTGANFTARPGSRRGGAVGAASWPAFIGRFGVIDDTYPVDPSHLRLRGIRRGVGCAPARDRPSQRGMRSPLPPGLQLPRRGRTHPPGALERRLPARVRTILRRCRMSEATSFEDRAAYSVAEIGHRRDRRPRSADGAP